MIKAVQNIKYAVYPKLLFLMNIRIIYNIRVVSKTNRNWTEIEQKLNRNSMEIEDRQWKLSSGCLARAWPEPLTDLSLSVFNFHSTSFQILFKFCSISVPFSFNFCFYRWNSIQLYWNWIWEFNRVEKSRLGYPLTIFKWFIFF